MNRQDRFSTVRAALALSAKEEVSYGATQEIGSGDSRQRPERTRAVPATSAATAAHQAPRPTRRGGLAVRAKYGPEFFATIGHKGGSAARDRHGHDFFANIGRRGGLATRDQHDSEYYSRIGRMGGLHVHQRERKSQDTERDTDTSR